MVHHNELISAASLNPLLFEQMYAQYQTDPTAVDLSWRRVFSAILEEEKIMYPRVASAESAAFDQLRVSNLIEAYRVYGHLMTQVNPLAPSLSSKPQELQLSSLGFEPSDLTRSFPTCGLLSQETVSLQEIINRLQEIYCGTIGFEYMHLQGGKFEQWLQQRIESGRFRTELPINQKQLILRYLNKSELFESFLHTKYVGQKRFSAEGAETVIPMLAELVEMGANFGVEDFVVGMAHRGRLNVLSNLLNKSYVEIFVEFEEGYQPASFEESGDVKYHKGYSSQITTLEGHRVQVILMPNASHLESVNPVMEGHARAKLVKKDDLAEKEKVLPILIHGDAAVSGQGVVYETMQMSKLSGYSTGGTIHIVINNQIGFTTLPSDSRSTRYCTDIAKTFNAPVFHVNAEDPEACVLVTRLAVEIRKQFHCDVFIDLSCYRKYGHNEGDEPAFTQPLEYQLIRQKKSIRELYRDQLIKEGIVEKKLAEQLEEGFKQALHKALEEAKDPPPAPKIASMPFKENNIPSVETAIGVKQLQIFAERFCSIPEGFQIHPKVEKLLQERLAMAKGERLVDWGMAETLAYASLLWEGISIRLTGQDSCRGTFSHRHAIWVDQVVERSYFPLAHLKENQGRFDLYNSLLSEYASLGFEYGYSMAAPDSLVIWEAQYGDFCNGAQIVIDQYISASEQKWGNKVPLVMLLPHGYEGQGPEHSSARMERFLSLSSNRNMVVANPSTPLQFFHLLRRNVLASIRKPLVIFTPKALLRHPASTNSIQEFSEGSFQTVIDDSAQPNQVTRLVFCSGRIFYDLVAERKKRNSENLAILRVEQLYPLDEERLVELMKQYKKAEEYMWVQEEAMNMGAWDYIQPNLISLLPKEAELMYVGRSRSSSPATGSYALHKKGHLTIMEQVFQKKSGA